MHRIAASPFFLISLLVGGFLLLGVLLLVAIQFQGVPPLTVPGAIQTVMPDGSILWLKVTSGTDHDFSIQVPESDPLERIFSPSTSRHFDTQTSENRFVIWLMRQDPSTGQPLDFDWWSRASVVDEHGRELFDDRAHRAAFFQYGSQSESGSRPFRPLQQQDYLGIVARSELPLFRYRGEMFTLRIHNTQDEVVAQFRVPYQLPLQPPKWSAEELPIRKSHGDLTVVLRDVAYEDREVVSGGETETVLRVVPDVEIEYGDVPTGMWRAGHWELADPLGNTAHAWHCDLDRYEPAWRLSATTARTTDAEFAPDEMWQIGPLAIPDQGKQELLSHKHGFQGVDVQLVAIGGAGGATYRMPDPERRSGGGSSSGSLNTSSQESLHYQIDVRYQDGVKTTSVACPLPHVVFAMNGRVENQGLLVRATDRDGQSIPAHLNTSIGDWHFVFLEPPPDTTHVDVTIILHRTFDFEFYIEPRPGSPQGG